MMRLSVAPVGMILMTIAMNTLRPYNYVIVPNRVSCGRIPTLYMYVHTVYERGSYHLLAASGRCLLSSMHKNDRVPLINTCSEPSDRPGLVGHCRTCTQDDLAS